MSTLRVSGVTRGGRLNGSRSSKLNNVDSVLPIHHCPKCGRQLVTAQQLRCLKSFIARGNMKEAGDDLGVAAKTVEYHLNFLRKVIKVKTLYQLVAWAFRMGLVTLFVLTAFAAPNKPIPIAWSPSPGADYYQVYHCTAIGPCNSKFIVTGTNYTTTYQRDSTNWVWITAVKNYPGGQLESIRSNLLEFYVSRSGAITVLSK